MVVFIECIDALFCLKRPIVRVCFFFLSLCVLLSSIYKRPKFHVNGSLKRQELKQQTEGEYRGAALRQSWTILFRLKIDKILKFHVKYALCEMICLLILMLCCHTVDNLFCHAHAYSEKAD